MYTLGFSGGRKSTENICTIVQGDSLGGLTGSEDQRQESPQWWCMCWRAGGPVAAQPKKLQTAEPEQSRMQHQSKVEGLKSQESLRWEPKETGDSCPKMTGGKD